MRTSTSSDTTSSDAPPPYTPAAPEAVSRSGPAANAVTSLADAMLRTSLTGVTVASSSSASTTIRTPSTSTADGATSTRTREKLRQAEAERDELRLAVNAERSLADQLRKARNPVRGTSADHRARVDELKLEAKTAAAATPRKPTDGIFKSACATDLLFLIDTTCSMKPYLDAAKTQVKSIMDDIKTAYLNEAEVRIAVVSHKDHASNPHIQFTDFTTSSDTIYKFLSKLKVGGGNDAPEDVLGGIHKGLNASWKNPNRVLIHIGDMPPHGRCFIKCKDDYPEPGSEPHGLTYEPLLKEMIGLGINYAHLNITAWTETMCHLFAKEYLAAGAECQLRAKNKHFTAFNRQKTLARAENLRKSWDSQQNGLLFQEASLGTSYDQLRHIVVNSVTSSASRTAGRYTQSLSRTDEKSGLKKGLGDLASISEDGSDVKSTPLERVRPKWNTPGWLNHTLELEGFSPDVVHGVSTLNNMMDDDDNIRLRPMELTIHKRARPFSEGAMRTAAYARTEASHSKFVYKSFKKGGRRLAHLAEDMRIQTLCKGFALEFNALTGSSLDFIVTTCLQARKGSGATSTEHASLEPYIAGDYVKYNSNSGYVRPLTSQSEKQTSDPEGDALNQAAQAFSHFTFERSCGHFLVCDLQGVGPVLTDPAIHTLDPDRFKLADTNLRVEGFKFFFSTHTCNDICTELGLKSNAAMLASCSTEKDTLSGMTFRERWPSMDNTVCCSSKLCGKIVRKASAKRSEEYPGCHWCEECYPQLKSTTVRRLCGSNVGGQHDFEASRFFYESLGKQFPRECAEHREGESAEARMASVGGSFWNRLKSATKQSSVSGKSW